jgi:hypothetical protein
VSATALRPKKGFGPDDMWCPRCDGIRHKGHPVGRGVVCPMPRPEEHASYWAGWPRALSAGPYPPGSDGEGVGGWRCGASLVPAEEQYQHELEEARWAFDEDTLDFTFEEEMLVVPEGAVAMLDDGRRIEGPALLTSGRIVGPL